MVRSGVITVPGAAAGSEAAALGAAGSGRVSGASNAACESAVFTPSQDSATAAPVATAHTPV